jgi:hypothetical protein
MSVALIISRRNTSLLKRVLNSNPNEKVMRSVYYTLTEATQRHRTIMWEAGTGSITVDVTASDTAQPLVILNFLTQEVQQAFHWTVLVINVHKH